MPGHWGHTVIGAGTWSLAPARGPVGAHGHCAGTWSSPGCVVTLQVRGHRTQTSAPPPACRTLSERREAPEATQQAGGATGHEATCGQIQDMRAAPAPRGRDCQRWWPRTALPCGQRAQLRSPISSSNGYALDRIHTNGGMACGPGFLGGGGHLWPSSSLCHRGMWAFLHSYVSTRVKVAHVFEFQICTVAHTHKGTELPDTCS